MNTLSAADRAVCQKIQTLHRTGNLAWFFDLDGTLVHAAPGVHTGVKRDEDLERILNTVAHQAGGALAVITGRPDVFTKGLLPGAQFAVATEHGAVMAVPGPAAAQVRGKARDFETIRRIVESGIGNVPGVYVEDHKVASLTIQFTEAADPESLTDKLTQIAQDVARDPRFADDADPLLVVAAAVRGNYVVDILSTKAEKASAVRYFTADAPFAGKTPIFFGDSEGDRRAMELCKAMGGIAVGIGSKAPACADIRLNTIHDARALLMYAAQLRQAGPAPSP